MADDDNNYPRTIEAAVRLLQGLVSEDEQQRIRSMSEQDLATVDFGLGQWIRNYLGLWGDNAPLLRATGELHADDASGMIVHALWQKLRDDLPRVH